MLDRFFGGKILEIKKGALVLYKKIFLMLTALIFCAMSTTSEGAVRTKILFIPHDDRPVSCQQTAEIARAIGIEIIMPPVELLGLNGADEHPDQLWQWFKENAKSARAAVVASDSLLYGGLIPSRKHEFSQEKLSAFVENFKTIREENPEMKLYVFASLMRTPMQGTKGDIEEPDYYAEYGANIFNYTALTDKSETSKLTTDEKNYLQYLKDNIPAEILNDWMSRRTKNFSATKKLIDFTNTGTIDYLIIGRDDNAPLSQTHKENRELLSYANKKNLSKEKFQSLAGIDEFNLLLLTRAINEMRGKVPKVNVQFNKGTGGKTVPAFSDEPIKDSIEDEIIIAGGKSVKNPNDADFILLVNTDINGETLWAHNQPPSDKPFVPNLIPSESTSFFANLAEIYILKGYKVGIADVNYCNGSDNALMKILHDKNLLFKIQSYAGWNTATNSTGFALSTGILSKYMMKDAKNKLLVRRYLDDWAFQANIRSIVGNELFYMPRGVIAYFQFDGEREYVEKRETELLQRFADEILPPYRYLRGLKVSNTWNRMFEVQIEFGADE